MCAGTQFSRIKATFWSVILRKCENIFHAYSLCIFFVTNKRYINDKLFKIIIQKIVGQCLRNRLITHQIKMQLTQDNYKCVLDKKKFD